ncbi:MAG: T9SS type A sorting domain-containing protein [Flavipsychrobacter sp.]|nr:T9SS type A sorting domain-containing protein [Flavipsychrobacter sp.]
MDKINYILISIGLFFIGLQCKAQVITTAAVGMANPYGIATDDSGNVYICDYGTACVKKLNKAGIVTTFAGNGIFAYSGDGGPATSASIFEVVSVAVDKHHNVYIADGQSAVIRKVNPSGIISTFAGTGTRGHSGDGGPATAAKLNFPQGVAVDDVGNVYVADGFNYDVRKIDTTGIITTFAGTGTSGFTADGAVATMAKLTMPTGVATDHNGNVYIADVSMVRRVNAIGILTTVAGNDSSGYSGDGGPATSALLSYVEGLTIDAAGNIFIADEDNNVIRKVDNSGIITTVAGNSLNASLASGQGSYTGDGGLADSAGFNTPVSVAVDSVGNLYISDRFNNAIRKVSAISGTTHICLGDTTKFSVPFTGGIWSSSVPGVARVNTTGVVTGVVAGTAAIYYSLGADTAATSVFVNATPSAGVITGTDSTCFGTITFLTDTMPGGMWSLTNTNANILGNKVTPVLPGRDTAIYKTHYTCGTATAQFPLTFISPDAGTITGARAVCAGDTIVFSDTALGGIWSLADTTIANMISPGVVKAIAPGLNDIEYTVTTALPGCEAFASIYFNIDSASHCAATGLQNTSIVYHKLLIYPNPAGNSVTITSGVSITSLHIIDCLGTTIYAQTTSGQKNIIINTIKLTSGIYFVTCETDLGDRICEKLIIQH